ncbi:unnamed protein product [Cylicocyclus nassatus]|uniref:Geminin n=1 Tax=Cylicocyclus nassatus TaxID=53992 RepID=A0AA36M5M2_CYLNA|nr:unnamed protein product [Cylicocyclus nassatus]
MLRIARKISDSQSASFSVFEDVVYKSEQEPKRRSIQVQTEISCDNAELSTEVSIQNDQSKSASEPADIVFWRAVATQRAGELDKLREDIEEVRAQIEQNVKEKHELDEKHDALYSQMEAIIQNSYSEDVLDGGT